MQQHVDGTELTEQHPRSSHDRSNTEFDPCCNAKIPSPFYQYNHDSPRASFEVKKQDPVQVAVHDVEAGSPNLSPSVTQEKRDAQRVAGSRFKFWQRNKQCLTKPKPRGCGWLSQMPPRQRLLVKVLIALVVIGAAVGIAVGISIRVHGGVYKSNNSTTQIG